MTDANYVLLKRDYLNFFESSGKIGDFFGGPSLYFHNRALEERKKNFLGESHLELVYATLSSWGMHRMGDTKTKMVEFTQFKDSIQSYKRKLVKLNSLKVNEIGIQSARIIEELNDICFSLSVSVSKSKIVGNSKTLAHILPDLVPPIDRRYTIRFFKNQPDSISRTISDFKGIDEEKKYFNFILDKTYDFINFIATDDKVKIGEPFNTSYPKIFDNLIISYIKHREE